MSVWAIQAVFNIVLVIRLKYLLVVNLVIIFIVLFGFPMILFTFTEIMH